MSADKYNGWANRETWALNLYLTNDQGLSELVSEQVAEALAAYKAGYAEADGMNLNDMLPHVAGEAVKNVWEEITDVDSGLMTAEAILPMVRDIGSEYRIDWQEIGTYWVLAALDES